MRNFHFENCGQNLSQTSIKIFKVNFEPTLSIYCKWKPEQKFFWTISRKLFFVVLKVKSCWRKRQRENWWLCKTLYKYNYKQYWRTFNHLVFSMLLMFGSSNFYAIDLKKQHELLSKWNDLKYELIHLCRKWMQLKDYVERNSLSCKVLATEWPFW